MPGSVGGQVVILMDLLLGVTGGLDKEMFFLALGSTGKSYRHTRINLMTKYSLL